MRLVHPEAKLPFDDDFWMESLQKAGVSFSLHLELNGMVIGHVAVRKTQKGKVVLFFILVAKEERGKGYGKALMKEVEKFIDKKFRPGEYFLNVVPTNAKAISLYKKFGFKVVSRKVDRIEMRKAMF